MGIGKLDEKQNWDDIMRTVWITNIVIAFLLLSLCFGIVGVIAITVFGSVCFSFWLGWREGITPVTGARISYAWRCWAPIVILGLLTHFIKTFIDSKNETAAIIAIWFFFIVLAFGVGYVFRPIIEDMMKWKDGKDKD